MKICNTIANVFIIALIASMTISAEETNATHNTKALDLEMETKGEFLPGFTRCEGEKNPDRFNDINCQDRETVELLSTQKDSTQHKVVEDKVNPEGNLFKKKFKPLLN